jgi:hypothetical protein
MSAAVESGGSPPELLVGGCSGGISAAVESGGSPLEPLVKYEVTVCGGCGGNLAA